MADDRKKAVEDAKQFLAEDKERRRALQEQGSGPPTPTQEENDRAVLRPLQQRTEHRAGVSTRRSIYARPTGGR
jgi:hypothetical protein